MARATKGGQYGANGEWYEGGQFVNTIAENPKKGCDSRRGTRKVEIAPYQWEVPPTSEHRSIFQMADCASKWDSSGTKLEVFTAAHPHYLQPIFGWTVQELVDKWNSGERWFLPKV